MLGRGKNWKASGQGAGLTQNALRVPGVLIPGLDAVLYGFGDLVEVHVLHCAVHAAAVVGLSRSGRPYHVSHLKQDRKQVWGCVALPRQEHMLIGQEGKKEDVYTQKFPGGRSPASSMDVGGQVPATLVALDPEGTSLWAGLTLWCHSYSVQALARGYMSPAHSSPGWGP